LYWLTEDGKAVRDQLAELYGRGPVAEPASVNWLLYGQLCFRHRRAVLLALQGHMRPPHVKKRALASNASLRMSVDNCREVLHWMERHGVVRRVRVGRECYASYELTEVGEKCQVLLRRAVTPAAA